MVQRRCTRGGGAEVERCRGREVQVQYSGGAEVQGSGQVQKLQRCKFRC
jgi:hypothetical protein